MRCVEVIYGTTAPRDWCCTIVLQDMSSSLQITRYTTLYFLLIFFSAAAAAGLNLQNKKKFLLVLLLFYCPQEIISNAQIIANEVACFTILRIFLSSQKIKLEDTNAGTRSRPKVMNVYQ